MKLTFSELAKIDRTFACLLSYHLELIKTLPFAECNYQIMFKLGEQIGELESYLKDKSNEDSEEEEEEDEDGNGL